MISPEYIHYIVDAGIVGLVWKVNRALNRWYDIMLDNPPHRHVNGSILYPKGFEPGEVQRVGAPSK